MTKNEWEGRKTNHSVTITSTLEFLEVVVPKSRPRAKNPPRRWVCNHNKMRRISVVFGSEGEGRVGSSKYTPEHWDSVELSVPAIDSLSILNLSGDDHPGAASSTGNRSVYTASQLVSIQLLRFLPLRRSF